MFPVHPLTDFLIPTKGGGGGGAKKVNCDGLRGGVWRNDGRQVFQMDLLMRNVEYGGNNGLQKCGTIKWVNIRGNRGGGGLEIGGGGGFRLENGR